MKDFSDVIESFKQFRYLFVEPGDIKDLFESDSTFNFRYVHSSKKCSCDDPNSICIPQGYQYNDFQTDFFGWNERFHQDKINFIRENYPKFYNSYYKHILPDDLDSFEDPIDMYIDDHFNYQDVYSQDPDIEFVAVHGRILYLNLPSDHSTDRFIQNAIDLSEMKELVILRNVFLLNEYHLPENGNLTMVFASLLPSSNVIFPDSVTCLEIDFQSDDTYVPELYLPQELEELILCGSVNQYHYYFNPTPINQPDSPSKLTIKSSWPETLRVIEFNYYFIDHIIDLSHTQLGRFTCKDSNLYYQTILPETIKNLEIRLNYNPKPMEQIPSSKFPDLSHTQLEKLTLWEMELAYDFLLTVPPSIQVLYITYHHIGIRDHNLKPIDKLPDLSHTQLSELILENTGITEETLPPLPDTIKRIIFK